RVIALFALLVRDPETAWLVLHDAEPDAFASALQRFVFRSKVAISVPDDLVAAGTWSGSRHGGEPLPDRRASGEELAAMAAPTEALLDMGGDGGGRILRISGDPGVGDPAAVARWDAFDLLHGLPRL